MTRQTVRKPRGFRLLVLSEGERYGIALEETNGAGKTERAMARVSGEHAARFLPALMSAVRGSGHSKSVLSSVRRLPIALDESQGVRLGLVLLATGPVRKARRIGEIAEGVAAMSDEETYYWYAKVTGSDGRRHLRALRLFLSAE